MGNKESKSKEATDRMQEDLCHVEQLLEHLNIEERKITKLWVLQNTILKTKKKE